MNWLQVCRDILSQTSSSKILELANRWHLHCQQYLAQTVCLSGLSEYLVEI
jgi:hypothetical protein